MLTREAKMGDRFRCGLLQLIASDRGATMPEYGLMLAFIASVVMIGAQFLGVNVLARFNELADSLAP